MIAFIGSLKDGTCTPKPAKLNALVHLKVTYELRAERTLASLFTQLCQCQSVSPAILLIVESLNFDTYSLRSSMSRVWSHWRRWAMGIAVMLRLARK